MKPWLAPKERYLNLSIQSMLIRLRLSLKAQLVYNVWCRIIQNFLKIVIMLVTQVLIKDFAFQHWKMIQQLQRRSIIKDCPVNQQVLVKPSFIFITGKCWEFVEQKLKRDKSMSSEEFHCLCILWFQYHQSLQLVSL